MNIPTKNNNPGDLKNSSGNFQSFSSIPEGKAALYNDLTAKMTGTSNTGLNGDSSLIDFSKKYAPSSDNNNSLQYAANLANKLGVSPDIKIGSLMPRIDDFANAISSNEGYNDKKSINPNRTYTNNSHSPERLIQYQAEGQLANKNSQEQNSLSSILGNTVQNIGDNLTFGGASQLGNELGTGFAKTYNQTKGLLGGQDNSQYMPDMSFGNTTGGLLKTLGGIGLTATGTGELNGVTNGKGIADIPVVKDLIESPRVGLSLGQFRSLPIDEQYNTLVQAVKDADEYTKAKIAPVLQQMLKEAPTIASKILPVLGKGLKGILNLAKMAGLVELGRGGQDIKGLLGLNNLTQ